MQFSNRTLLENNIKIRYNMLDIKVFVKEEKGLQQWNPRMKGEFTLKMEIIRNKGQTLVQRDGRFRSRKKASDVIL